MFQESNAFSSFSVKDIQAAKEFYGETLGLAVKEAPEGLELQVAGSRPIFLYFSVDNNPAGYTVLNFPVEDIDQTVDSLAQLGVQMERYDSADIKTDQKGVMRGDGSMRPKAIAWFKDPSGNILSVLQEE